MNRDPQAWSRLGHALKRARDRAGLTQAEVAHQADVSVFSVQAAEGGTVPKRRMPYAVQRIAGALGWPAGAIEAVLEGEHPPGEWRDIPAPIPSERLATILTNAMIRGADNMTAAEIRAVTETAIAQLREEGLISEEDAE